MCRFPGNPCAEQEGFAMSRLLGLSMLTLPLGALVLDVRAARRARRSG